MRTLFAGGLTVPRRIREGRILCKFCGGAVRPEPPIDWWPADPATDTSGFWTGHHCNGQQIIHPAEGPQRRADA
jgi:hypothetical protein